jgi:hypothetical protein
LNALAIQDQLDAIAQADDGTDIEPMCLALGEKARKAKDTSQAILGELMLHMTERYGDATAAEYARKLKMDADTLRGYRRVVKLYGGKAVYVESMLAAGVSWSIIKEAANHFPDDASRAVAFLDDGATADMTVIEARAELAKLAGKPPKPRVRMDCEAQITDARYIDGVLIFEAHVLNGIDALLNAKGHMMRVTVREIEVQL